MTHRRTTPARRAATHDRLQRSAYRSWRCARHVPITPTSARTRAAAVARVERQEAGIPRPCMARHTRASLITRAFTHCQPPSPWAMPHTPSYARHRARKSVAPNPPSCAILPVRAKAGTSKAGTGAHPRAGGAILGKPCSHACTRTMHAPHRRVVCGLSGASPRGPSTRGSRPRIWRSTSRARRPAGAHASRRSPSGRRRSRRPRS